MKPIIKNIKYFWHFMNLQKNQAMLDGCLDNKIREKLLDKIHHHEINLNRYKPVK